MMDVKVAVDIKVTGVEGKLCHQNCQWNSRDAYCQLFGDGIIGCVRCEKCLESEIMGEKNVGILM
ncbi:MAG TPA: hypothetical protein DDY17_04000 [Syntrophaceae bacterium]|jgi:hypothetical protein|nr:hypothetical protein [Syntrophaceae bacterium]